MTLLIHTCTCTLTGLSSTAVQTVQDGRSERRPDESMVRASERAVLLLWKASTSTPAVQLYCAVVSQRLKRAG